MNPTKKKYRLTYTWTENNKREEDIIVLTAHNPNNALQLGLNRLPLYKNYPGAHLETVTPI